MMTSVTTVNVTPVPSVSASAITQSAVSVTNTQVSPIPVANSAVTAMTTVVATAMAVNTTNSINPTLNVNLLGPDNSQLSYQVLTKQRLHDLVREVDSNVLPDEDVEDLLLQIAEEFIYELADTACKIAKHRKSNTLEVKDVQLSLEKHWNMWIPGFGGEELRPYKKSAVTDAHRQRMNLIKRNKK